MALLCHGRLLSPGEEGMCFHAVSSNGLPLVITMVCS